MMTHPDELFELAKQRLEQNQRESSLANAQACLLRHLLAERVHKLADRLEPSSGEPSMGLAVGKR
jgi:hypothetical protein